MDATGSSTSPEWVWLNGRVLRRREATLDLDDRGFQFADGVYEVLRLYAGRPFAIEEHLERLRASCAGIAMNLGFGDSAIREGFAELQRRTPLRDGMIYLQATRGVAPRNHVFDDATPATLLFYAKPLSPAAVPGGAGARVISMPDERWKRCWVKSIALLPNVLAKTQAARAGADEAILIDDGVAHEGATSNLFIVRDGRLITAPPGPKVLPGVTRLVLLRLAASLGIDVEHRPPTEAEALAADEVFIASTTREIHWVRQWDSQIIGDGRVGPITLRLHESFRDYVESFSDQRRPSGPLHRVLTGEG
jgi:D-alanine transaminase